MPNPPRRLLFPALTLAAAALAAAPAPAAVPDLGVVDPGRPGVDSVPDQVIVRFDPGTSAAERAAARDAANTRVEEQVDLPRTQVLEVENGQTVAGAVSDLESDPGVTYAEPNSIDRIQAIPNDTLFSSEWGLNNIGQALPGIGAGTPDADIDAPEAWDTPAFRGSPGAVVADLDTGISAAHPDLSGQIDTNAAEASGTAGVDDDANGKVDDIRGWDFVNNDNDPRDGSGHGTHTAGTIGATGDNARGVAGVSWNARVLPLQVCASEGGCTITDQADAIAYAAGRGVKVINMSLGGTQFSATRRAAIAAAPNVLFSISAGNDNQNNDAVPHYPCQDDQVGGPALGNVICVAASTSSDTRASFSDYGRTAVDLAAPGESVASTYATFSNVLTDGFETAGGWDYTAIASPTGWERVATGQRTGSFAIQDSAGGNYAANDDAVVTSNALDLSGMSNCSASFFYKESVAAGDTFRVLASSDGVAFRSLFTDSGNNRDFPAYSREGVALDSVSGSGTVYLRFELSANGDASVADGVSIDDVNVHCPVAGESYVYLSGTSMAAPHVSGIAALLAQAQPSLTPAQLKSRILSNADPVAAFSGITVSGGRANLAKALSPPPAGVQNVTAPVPAVPGGGDSAAAPTAAPPVPAAAPGPTTPGLSFRGFGAAPKHANGALLRLTLGSAGKVAAVARDARRVVMARGTVSSAHAGAVSLLLEPTSAGRKLLRSKERVAVGVSLRFRPADGSSGIARTVSAALLRGRSPRK